MSLEKLSCFGATIFYYAIVINNNFSSQVHFWSKIRTTIKFLIPKIKHTEDKIIWDQIFKHKETFCLVAFYLFIYNKRGWGEAVP